MPASKVTRYTMATELRNSEVPAWEVAGFLGHRTEGTTERYAKGDPSRMLKAKDAIDAYCEALKVKLPMVFNPMAFRASPKRQTRCKP